MKKSAKVAIILGVIVLLAIFIAIFAMSTSEVPNKDVIDVKELQVLNDNIKALKEDISKYKEELEKMDSKRESIRQEIKVIIKDNEKIDTELANGDWDTNIKFLTDFLSKKDSVDE